MMAAKVSNVSKVWFRFSKTIQNGKKMVFRWEQVPEQRFEEFLDFKMNYYVNHEITHVAAGIHKNPKAMEEFREIVSKKYKNPEFYNAICCVDDDSKEIVAFNSLRLYKKGENYKDDVQPHTDEVKKFYQILDNWDSVFPFPDVLTRYGVDMFLDDAGAAIRPNYRGYGFTHKINLLRYTVTKANGVPLTGAWMTSAAVQKSSKLDGWETVVEVSTDKMENILEVKFQNPPAMFAYKIKRSD